MLSNGVHKVTRRAETFLKSKSFLDPKLVASVQSIVQMHQSRNEKLLLVEDISNLSKQGLRVPVKYLCPIFLKSKNFSLENCLHVMESAGRLNIYFEELFKFAFSKMSEMNGTQLATFVYECGRHGLRCKHYVGNLKRDNQIQGNEDLCRFFQGICKFSDEYPNLIEDMVKRLNVDELTPQDSLIVLRVIRSLSAENEVFLKFLKKIDTNLFSLDQQLGLIYLLKTTRKFRSIDNKDVKSIISDMVCKIRELEKKNFEIILATDISDAMDGLASLRVKDEKILHLFMSVLSDRIAEIKYSPICGLWQSITDSLGHMKLFHPQWMKLVVQDIGSSPFQLKTFAAFQLVFFTSSLGRLNFYNQNIYSSIATVVAGDVGSIQDADMLATLLVPFERANAKGEATDALMVAVGSQLEKICTNKGNFDRKTVRGTISAIQSILILSEGNEKSMENLMNIVIPKLKLKCLLDNDYPKLFRIQTMIGNAPIVPKWATQHRNYTWHENQRNQFDKFVDKMNLDGTAVIIDDQERMRQWKNPDNPECFELEYIPISGQMAALQKIVQNQGFKKVHVIHQESLDF